MEKIHAIGRRKASVARVYLTKGKGKITINKKDAKVYFPLETLQANLYEPFVASETVNKFDISASVKGGGTTGQADAIKLAISRALCLVDESYRPNLKSEGLLSRDSRVVERKKPGQKKARKKFQWVKR